MQQGHLFKWVEDAVREEVKDGLPKLGSIENEMICQISG